MQILPRLYAQHMNVLKRGLKSMRSYALIENVMKAAILYAVTAIILGFLTIIALLVMLDLIDYEALTSPSKNNMLSFLDGLDKVERTYEDRGALEEAVGTSDLLYLGLMLTSSFLVASGISKYIKKWIPPYDWMHTF